jgi:nicotinamidase-related amidase
MNIPDSLNINDTILILIDFQERLFPAMYEKEKLLNNVLKLTRGAQVLQIPVVVTEQYPKGLGPTLPEIKGLLPDIKPIEKICFSCCDNEAFCRIIGESGRRQLLIAGIEAHICVYQTAMEMSRRSYQVRVISDCISSRDPENKRVALSNMTAAGISPTTSEMVLFELLKKAGGDNFKQISAIVK